MEDTRRAARADLQRRPRPVRAAHGGRGMDALPRAAPARRLATVASKWPGTPPLVAGLQSSFL